MFKLVVLSALLAVAAARPGYLSAHSAVVAPAVALPSAVSHQYRSDVIVSSPVVTAHAAPAIVEEAVVAAPAIVEKAIVAAPVAVPAAVSHTYRSDVVSAPVVAAHAAHAVVAAPVAYGAHLHGAHAW